MWAQAVLPVSGRTVGRTATAAFILPYPEKNVDGHDFIGAAFDKGAVCALANRVPAEENRPVIVVPDVEAALRTLAEAYRKRLNMPVIGITGSVGKTTTKEMVASVLAQGYCVHKTEKNFNNELGVPLTLLQIESEHQVSVVEIGISDFGEMTRLARMVRPTMAVYTVIGHSHLEKLRDRNGVLQAKTELLNFCPQTVLFLRMATTTCFPSLIAVKSASFWPRLRKRRPG